MRRIVPSALIGLIVAAVPLTAISNECIDGLSIRPKSGKIQLSWTHVGQGVDYDVERRSAGGGDFQRIATTQSTYSIFLDTSVDNGVLYYYRVRRLPGIDGDGSCVSDDGATIAADQGTTRYRTLCPEPPADTGTNRGSAAPW